MRRLSFFALVGMLSFFLSSCNAVGNLFSRFTGNDSAEDTPGSSVTVVPVPLPKSEETPSDSEEGFADPLVEGEDVKPQASAPSDLIKSTNPNERANQVQRSRTDPFVSLPIPPPPRPEEPTPGASSQSPTNSNGANAQQSPGGDVEAPGLPVLPPLPQPDLAIAVRITGVSRIGNRLHAIVSSSDGASEYVREGQRIANGQVLVKRIEVHRGGEPIVILEQNGIEVAKLVGEGVDDPGQSAAAISSSTSVLGNKT